MAEAGKQQQQKSNHGIVGTERGKRNETRNGTETKLKKMISLTSSIQNLRAENQIACYAISCRISYWYENAFGGRQKQQHHHVCQKFINHFTTSKAKKK